MIQRSTKEWVPKHVNSLHEEVERPMFPCDDENADPFDVVNPNQRVDVERKPTVGGSAKAPQRLLDEVVEAS